MPFPPRDAGDAPGVFGSFPSFFDRLRPAILSAGLEDDIRDRLEEIERRLDALEGSRFILTPTREEVARYGSGR